MPLVEIFSGLSSPEALSRAAQVVHEVLVSALKIPPDDRFQLLRRIEPGMAYADAHYLGIERTSESLFIRITLRSGRTAEMKSALHRKIAENLVASVSVRPEDIFIVLVENELIDWSFGNGVAQYAKA